MTHNYVEHGNLTDLFKRGIWRKVRSPHLFQLKDNEVVVELTFYHAEKLLEREERGKLSSLIFSIA